MATDVAQFFMALKRTKGCTMMLDDSVAEDLSRMQNRNPLISIPHTNESPVPPQEKYDSRK